MRPDLHIDLDSVTGMVISYRVEGIATVYVGHSVPIQPTFAMRYGGCHAALDTAVVAIVVITIITIIAVVMIVVALIAIVVIALVIVDINCVVVVVFVTHAMEVG